MKVGDLVRNINTGELIIFLGETENCYHFWHHEFKDCYFNFGNWRSKNWEIVNESR